MSVPRPTEMTVRDLLQEELRKRGVTVIPEFSVSTPVGRMMPDGPTHTWLCSLNYGLLTIMRVEI